MKRRERRKEGEREGGREERRGTGCEVVRVGVPKIIGKVEGEVDFVSLGGRAV